MNQNTLNPHTKLNDGMLKVDKLNFNNPLEVQIQLNDLPWLDKILYDLIKENNPSNNNKE